jgi:hypothetical protein
MMMATLMMASTLKLPFIFDVEARYRSFCDSLVEMGYHAGETLRKSLQRIPQSSRAVTQPRTGENIQNAPTRAMKAGDFFRIQPGHHLTTKYISIGIESKNNQDVINIIESAKHKRISAPEVLQKIGSSNNSYLVADI